MKLCAILGFIYLVGSTIGEQNKDCPKNCNGTGECINGTCVCFEDFRGVDCATEAPSKLCPSECSGRGQCNKSLGTCECDKGYKGSDCSTEICPLDCSQHGECDTASSKCKCDAGWQGPGCDSLSCPNNCSGHGACKKNGSCACDAEFGGFDCGEPACTANCSLRGLCVHDASAGTSKCDCFPPYTGDNCRVCDNSYCNNNGQCHDPLTSSPIHSPAPMCYCDSMFTGRFCEISKCPTRKVNEVCSGHGSCASTNGDFLCTCEANYSGADCSIPSCNTDSSHFICGTSTCEEGWTGEKCDIASTNQCLADPTSNLPCSGHGVCENNQCYCLNGFMPPHCAHQYCFKSCSGHGFCRNDACVCEDLFMGEDCADSFHSPTPTVEICRDVILKEVCKGDCGGRGLCDIKSGLCNCVEPYFGAACELSR